MKICILTHTFPRFAGDKISSIFMSEVAQSLVDAGNEVWVLTPFTPAYKPFKTNYHLITYKYIFPDFLHKLGYSETLTNDLKFPIIMWLLSPFMYLFGFLALLRLVLTEKIDVVNAHWVLPNGFIATAVSMLTGTPVVSTLPGSDVYMAKKNILFKVLAIFATWKSKWITSNSGQLILDLDRITGINFKNKSSTIVYGIGSDKFKPDKILGEKTRNALGYSKKTIVVLGVGRLVTKKGFEYLIKAIPEIVKTCKNVQIAIIGDGDQKQHLIDVAKQLGVLDHIKFLGSISYVEMNKYYNTADIFILPSIRDEGGNLDDQSVAVMDAMSCGKPVITTNFPGYRLVIKNGINGFLTEEKDSQMIAQRIVDLAKTKSLRDKLGQAARQSMINDFSWPVIGRQYTKLFSSLVTNNYSQSVPEIFDESGRLRIARQFESLIKIELGNTKTKSCLDIGCSSGVITNYLAPKFKKIIGVDTDSTAVAKASGNCIAYDGKRLPFFNNVFDVVICNQVFGYTQDPEGLALEIYRVLKPGGKCLLSLRNKYSFIEGQSGLPLIHFLPNKIAKIVASILKRPYYPTKLLSLSDTQRVFKKFKIKNITMDIIRDPLKYGFTKLMKISLNPELLLFVPNYIIWLTK